jgi:16S rRNA (cytosine967-C5)-methyltransferase
MGARASAVSPARAAAFAVVRRVFEQGAYADRALAGEAAALEGRERALATRIAYGTVQRQATLDHCAARLLERELAELEPAVLAALRTGLFQLLYMRVPAHAVLNETVELAKASSRGGAGLVNAVLRRATREAAGLLAELDDATPAGAALMHSVPAWLAELWWRERGAAEARALLRRINEPPESAVRCNTLAGSVAKISAALPVAHHPAPGLPEGMVLEEPFDLERSELWERGMVIGQSRASMLAARLLRPRPGERVLDLCAAPGAKTTHLAALMEDRGEVVAVERHRGRATALERTAARMRAGCVRVWVGDAREPPAGEFDRVLVDPPCSGLGTLQSRPDRRWRATPDAIGELAALQAQLLSAAAAALRPGGRIVYSVCTISRREGAGVVAAVTAERADLEVEDLGAAHPRWRDRHDPRCLQLLPHRDLTDGFFFASLRRHRA